MRKNNWQEFPIHELVVARPRLRPHRHQSADKCLQAAKLDPEFQGMDPDKDQGTGRDPDMAHMDQDMAWAQAYDPAAALDMLKQYYSEFLPSNERVLAFADATIFCTLEQQHKLYCTPIRTVLESNVINPPPPRLQY